MDPASPMLVSIGELFKAESIVMLNRRVVMKTDSTWLCAQRLERQLQSMFSED